MKYVTLLLAAFSCLQGNLLAQVSSPSRPAAVVSPQIATDHRVTFRLRAPAATEVELLGLPTSPLPMTKDAEGVWSITPPDPLPPDLYAYTFMVDGARVPDPVNLTNTWAPSAVSMLAIPGALWTDTAVTHGAVAKHLYDSATVGGPETYFVYTPPNYDAHRSRPYPVLVALHGLGGPAQDWIVQGGANITLDALIGLGKAEPMILITPAANGNMLGTRAAAAGFPNFTRALLEEILPQVERTYNASKNPADHAVVGQSAGGAQTLLLLNHTDQFQWFGVFSPGTDMFEPGWGTNATPPAVNGQRAPLPDGELQAKLTALGAAKSALPIKLLYLSCGTQDDHLALTRQVKQFLEMKKLKVNYLEGNGALHTYDFWRPQFASFAAMIFR